MNYLNKYPKLLVEGLLVIALIYLNLYQLIGYTAFEYYIIKDSDYNHIYKMTNDEYSTNLFISNYVTNTNNKRIISHCYNLIGEISGDFLLYRYSPNDSNSDLVKLLDGKSYVHEKTTLDINSLLSNSKFDILVLNKNHKYTDYQNRTLFIFDSISNNNEIIYENNTYIVYLLN